MDLKQYIKNDFFVIAGPCVVESREVCLEVADQLAQVSQQLNIPIIFKASYKKANRTSHQSFTGIGEGEALKILEEVKSKTGLPILSDVHEMKDVELVKDVIDIFQIPAFLCRQTDLIQAAGNTGKPINIKKGQFASHEIMQHAIKKLQAVGNEQGMLTERGTFLGYRDLVVDMRNIPWMKQTGVPVIYDATHSVQQPTKDGSKSGGVREMIIPLCDAAIAIGADGLFLETHPEPAKGLSDASSMLPLVDFKKVVERAYAFYSLRKNLG